MKMLSGSVLAFFLLTGFLAVPPDPPKSDPSVFELPGIQAKYAVLQAETLERFKSGQYAEAESLCREATRLIPHASAGHYNLACALARQGKLDEAVRALDRAVSLGFKNAAKIEQDEDFAPLRGREDFRAILKRAPDATADPNAGWKFTVAAEPIDNGVAMVTEKNTLWDLRIASFRSLFKFADKPPQAAINGFGEAGDLLRKWYAEGTAAGNHGDLYDNHDSDHSNMDYGSFPQLARVEFAEAARKSRVHHGLQLSFLYNAPTIGNSSTAMVNGWTWRSQARHALTRPLGPQLLHLQYTNNHLYVYPEHRDHDPGRNGADGKGHGDVFAANTPYMIVSQGSSGSDRAFLHAVCATMAAFRPDVKAELVRSGGLMPAVQMIFRQSNKMVQKPEDYLTGKAHPTVFDGNQIDMVRMVKLAHEMTTDGLPPVVQIEMVDEDLARPGIDFFDAAQSERFFDTPCAIARIARSTKHSRRIVVSAQKSRDPKQKPLTYHWAVLRGDADRIRINRRGVDGAVAEIVVPYHERRPVQPGSDLESSRVDIGAFVSNGKQFSAPAFVSVFFLENQKRVYDAQQRIQSVDYAAAETSKNYVDPLLDCRKDWRDEYRYDASGTLLGWTRTRGDKKEEFNADGGLVIKADAEGRPAEVKRVRYVAKRNKDQPPTLEQQVTDDLPK